MDAQYLFDRLELSIAVKLIPDVIFSDDRCQATNVQCSDCGVLRGRQLRQRVNSVQHLSGYGIIDAIIPVAEASTSFISDE